MAKSTYTVINGKKYFAAVPYNTLFPEPQMKINFVTGRCEAGTTFAGAACLFAPSTYANGFITNTEIATGDDLTTGEQRIFSCEIVPYNFRYPTIPYPKGNAYTYTAGDIAIFAEWLVNMEGWLYCAGQSTGYAQGNILTLDTTDGEVDITGDEGASAHAWICLATATATDDWVYGRYMGIVEMN